MVSDEKGNSFTEDSGNEIEQTQDSTPQETNEQGDFQQPRAPEEVSGTEAVEGFGPTIPTSEGEAVPPVPPTYPPQQGFTPPQGEEVAAVKGKGFPIVPVAIGTAVVVVLVIAGFLLKGVFGRGGLAKNPPDTLREAIVNTGEDIKSVSDDYPNHKWDTHAPGEFDFDLKLSEPDNVYSVLPYGMENFAMQVGAKWDVSNKEFLGTLGMNFMDMTIAPSTAYITPDKVALSIPDIYADHEYFTLNTATFFDDWNNSDMGSSIYEDYTLKEYIEIFFQFLQSSQEQQEAIIKDTEVFEKAINEAVKQLEERMEITYVETTEEAFVFTALITSGDAERFMQTLANEINNYYYNNIRRTVEAIPDEFFEEMYYYYDSKEEYIADSMEDIEDYTDVLKYMRFAEDLNFDFDVNKDKITLSKISLKPVEVMVVDPEYSSTDSIIIGFTAYLKGEKHVIDDMTIDFHIASTDDVEDSLDFSLNHFASKEEGVLGGRWEIVAEDTYYDETDEITLFFEFGWDTKNTTSANTSIKIGMSTKLDDLTNLISIRGQLDIEDNKLSFKDGRLTMLENTTELFIMDFNLAYNTIASGQVAPKISSSVDFFDVDWEKAFENLNLY